MSITIQDIIEIVLKAMKEQGMSLTQRECDKIRETANKILKDLLEPKILAKFSVIIPCDVTKATIRNRTVRRLIRTIKPCVQWDFELSNKTLTLRDSYDVFEGDIGTLPLYMTIDKNIRPYSYIIKEGN